MSSAINTLLKKIYINSSPAYRDPGGSNENFTITENGHHFGPPLAPKRVKLASATIPYTWYNVTAANNTFTLVRGGSPLITIPPGNYDGPSLAAQLTTLMNAVDVNGYLVTFSAMTFKLTFTGVAPFALDFTPVPSAAMVLGFSPGTVTPSNTSQTAPNIVGLVPDFEIFICSDLVGGSDNGVIMFTPDPPSSRCILARIPVNACYGNFLTVCGCESSPFFDMRPSPYVEAAIAPSEVRPPPARVMRFWLEFPSGLPVNLNGEHWSAELLMDFGSEVNI